MLSKEEIEKAKEKTKKWIYNMRTGSRVNIIHKGDKVFCDDLETLLKYIQELETSNEELDRENNRLEKIEFERDKANKIIDEMAEYLAIIRDCPNEDKGANLDCENRCSNDDSIYAECWKQYFEKKVEEK